MVACIAASSVRWRRRRQRLSVCCLSVCLWKGARAQRHRSPTWIYVIASSRFATASVSRLVWPRLPFCLGMYEHCLSSTPGSTSVVMTDHVGKSHGMAKRFGSESLWLAGADNKAYPFPLPLPTSHVPSHAPPPFTSGRSKVRYMLCCTYVLATVRYADTPHGG